MHTVTEMMNSQSNSTLRFDKDANQASLQICFRNTQVQLKQIVLKAVNIKSIEVCMGLYDKEAKNIIIMYEEEIFSRESNMSNNSKVIEPDYYVSNQFTFKHTSEANYCQIKFKKYHPHEDT